MIKVAYLALAPFISGSERSLQILLSYAFTADITPILISPENSPMHEWAEQHDITSYQVNIAYISPRSNPLKWLTVQYKLLNTYRKEKIDLIHSNQIWSFPSQKFVSFIYNLPTVCHLRDPLDADSNWWLSPGPDTVICISNYIKNDFEKYIKKDFKKNSQTLINPVTLPDTIQCKEQWELLSQKAKLSWKIPAKLKVLGFIGQISEIKGVYELIDTVSLLTDHKWRLLIAGQDPSANQGYIKRCKALISNRGLESQIDFIGFIDKIDAFYNAVDLVVMYSKEEPLGRIPLEAGAHYTPTLASNVGGLPETIVHNETGWLESQTGTRERAHNLSQILTMDLTKAGFNARKFVENISHPEKYVKKISAIYNSLL